MPSHGVQKASDCGSSDFIIKHTFTKSVSLLRPVRHGVMRLQYRGKRPLSKPKNQHWVPRFYIKEFSIPETKNKKNPQVWIFSKFEGDPQKVNISDIAAKRYLYSPKNEQGQRNWKTEDKLASLETTISKFWPHVANEFVNLDEEWVRKGLSLFIATLILRHPAKLEEYNKLQDELISLYDSYKKDEFSRPNISHVEINNSIFKLDKKDWFKYKNPSSYDRQKFFVDMIHRETIELANILMKKRWSIVFSNEPCFITTDQPIAVFNRKNDKFGLATEGSYISFPLSTTRILVLDDLFEEPGSQYYSLSENNSAAINTIHWTHAHNFMITHRHPDEVSYEMVSFSEGNATDL